MSNELHATDAITWLVRLDIHKHIKAQSLIHFILHYINHFNFRLFKHTFMPHQRQL